MWPNHNFKKKLKFLFLNVWPNFDSETKSASNKFIISPTKTNLFLKEFTFNWPIIALFILSNLCFFILLMSLEETLSPITKRKLSLTLSLYSFQLKFVRKVLKSLRSTEIPVLFRFNLLLFKCLFGCILLWVIIPISFRHVLLLDERWLRPSTFCSKRSARQTIQQIMILLFSVFIDFIRVTFSSEIFSDVCLTLFRMCLFVAAHWWGAKKPPPPQPPLQNLPHISYDDETWHSYILLKEDSHPLSYAEIRIFSPEISKFCYIRKCRYRVHFNA